MKANLVLNGEPSNNYLDKFDRSIYTVCADGGYNWCRVNNIKVDKIIGDLDSVLDANSIDNNLVMRYNMEKNETDGQLALEYLITNGYNDINIICAGGGRDDHYLANLGLLDMCLSKKVKCKLITNYSEIQLFDTSKAIKMQPNTVFSLVPFCSDLHILYIHGAKYNTYELKMPAFSPRGISNIAESDEVRIDIVSGKYLVLIQI